MQKTERQIETTHISHSEITRTQTSQQESTTNTCRTAGQTGKHTHPTLATPENTNFTLTMHHQHKLLSRKTDHREQGSAATLDWAAVNAGLTGDTN